MTRIFKLLLVFVLVTACEPDQGYLITGTIDDLADGTQVYLNEIDANNRLAVLDTTELKNGTFTFDPAEVEYPKMNIVTINGTRGNIIFIAENEEVKITAQKDSINNAKIKGGEENKYFKKYFDEVQASNKERQRLNQEGMSAVRARDTAQVDVIRNELDDINKTSSRSRIKLIKENPDKFVSLIIFQDLLALQLIKADEAEEIFESLSEDIQSTDKAKKLQEAIAQMKSRELASAQAEVGNKAPDFKGPTPEGNDLALSDALGKYTIIDFWASWCKPCRAENPNVVNVYNKYHDKGLNIISVSLDRPDNRERWIKAIENDNMNWQHVSYLMEWQDPIARKYGITSIPATFLLDENGVIIDKNLRGKDLQDKMESLFSKS